MEILVPVQLFLILIPAPSHILVLADRSQIFAQYGCCLNILALSRILELAETALSLGHTWSYRLTSDHSWSTCH